jgi:hypothetical protein
MLVPSLPEKTKNVLQSDSFLQSRIRGLTMFLEHVVQSPYMRNDESVARFFTATDEHAWDAAKKVCCVVLVSTAVVFTPRWLTYLGDGGHGECGTRPLAVAYAHHRRVNFGFSGC